MAGAGVVLYLELSPNNNEDHVTTCTTSSKPDDTTHVSLTHSVAITNQFTTTIAPPVDGRYRKDVILLLDGSMAMKTPKNFNRVKTWITDNLLKGWQINSENVQVAFCIYSKNQFNLLVGFSNIGATMNDLVSAVEKQYYNNLLSSSITNGLRGATSMNRRRQVSQTTILISASEDQSDIDSAKEYAFELNSFNKQLITITVNSATNGSTLGKLSKSQTSFFGIPDFNLTSSVSKRITEYMFASNTSSSYSNHTFCPDCVPKGCNILVMLEPNTDSLENQKKLLKGDWTTSWNHFERMNVIGYGATPKKLNLTKFGAFQDKNQFLQEVDGIVASNVQSTIASAFKLAVDSLQGTRPKTRIVIFTSAEYDSSDQTVAENARLLRTLGKVIIITMGVAETNELAQLCDVVVSWKDMINLSEISTHLNSILNT